MTEQHVTDTSQKALAINLNPERYGVFAEIGAGQEVSRWFFRVGAAAGTVAKSVSAYDMQVSDRTYGRTERYVSRERLLDMLAHEQAECEATLVDARGSNTTFFVFADTVAAASYRGGGECHGWLGVRLQHRRDGPFSQIVMHVRMLDSTNLQQQEALGIVGVNLIYGAFEHFQTPERLVASLLDNLSVERIEVDMIELSGAAFDSVDNRVMSLHLVELGLTPTALFDSGGHPLQPAEVLYRKPVLIQPGRFRPPTIVSAEIQLGALAQFGARRDVSTDAVVSMLSMNLNDLVVGQHVDYGDFCDRIDVLASGQFMVLITNFREYFRLPQYVSRYTDAAIGIALGVSNISRIFDEDGYDDLEGGLLEALGRLFKKQVQLLVYPELTAEGAILSVTEVKLPVYDAVFRTLLAQRRIEAITQFNPDTLHVRMDDVRERIARDDPAWRSLVPARAVEVIEQRGLFGYVPR